MRAVEQSFDYLRELRNFNCLWFVESENGVTEDYAQSPNRYNRPAGWKMKVYFNKAEPAMENEGAYRYTSQKITKIYSYKVFAIQLTSCVVNASIIISLYF